MPAEQWVVVHTAGRRYAIRPADTLEIRTIASTQQPVANEIWVDLGQRLDPLDAGGPRPRFGLDIPLRRRHVILLVHHVDTIEPPFFTHPLPPILHARLREPWALGAFSIEDTLTIQIDVRAVARSVLLSPLQQETQ